MQDKHLLNECGNVQIKICGVFLANIYLTALRSRYSIQDSSNLIAALAIKPTPFSVIFVA